MLVCFSVQSKAMHTSVLSQSCRLQLCCYFLMLGQGHKLAAEGGLNMPWPIGHSPTWSEHNRQCQALVQSLAQHTKQHRMHKDQGSEKKEQMKAKAGLELSTPATRLMQGLNAWLRAVMSSWCHGRWSPGWSLSGTLRYWCLQGSDVPRWNRRHFLSGNNE